MWLWGLIFSMQITNKIHKSLYKPVLFVGCERLPFTLISAMGGIILMQYQNIYSIVLVFIFYVWSVALIRRVNLNDSQFFMCLVRYIRFYKDYYPANEFYPGVIDNPRSFLG